MANKSDFTAEEWKKLLESPLLAGFAVSAGDPSGFIGTLQEGFASAKALATAKSDPNADALIKAVVDDLLTPDGRAAARDGVKGVVDGAKVEEFKDRALVELRRTASILDSKAPNEFEGVQGLAQPYRQSGGGSGRRGRLSGLWRGEGHRRRTRHPGGNLHRA